MRLAIVSDIHANLEALEAVLEDIDAQSIDETVCLGDIVGYGADPNECVDLVKQRCPISVLGNHDAASLSLLSTQNFNIHARIAIEWTAGNLLEATRSYLKPLQLKKLDHQLSLVHATPYEPDMWHYITSLEEAAFNFHFFDTQFCFVGHTHIPLIIVVNGKRELYVYQGNEIRFNTVKNARFLINVGSVGQPRDRDPRASYGVLDLDNGSFTHRRVRYDIRKCQAKMKRINMPEFLIGRLKDGR
jgi:predicted phosphodiesterase